MPSLFQAICGFLGGRHDSGCSLYPLFQAVYGPLVAGRPDITVPFDWA